jgi:hypothetical protein
MRLPQFFSLALLASFLLVGCGGTTGPDDDNGNADSGEWRGDIAQGDVVAITGVSGPILAAFTSGNETVVRWTKTGNASQFSLVSIDIVEDAAGVAIVADYPEGEIDVDVTFEAEVPTGVDFAGTVVSGQIVGDGLASDVLATTVSGNVTIATTGDAAVAVVSGNVDAVTGGDAVVAVVSGNVNIVAGGVAEAGVVSGIVDAVIGLADWGRDLNFEVQSGDLSVEVPANTNAEVAATVLSGTITSDFPLSGTPNNQQGTLGSGGPTLMLLVESGDILLTAGPDA